MKAVLGKRVLGTVVNTKYEYRLRSEDDKIPSMSRMKTIQFYNGYEREDHRYNTSGAHNMYNGTKRS